MPRCYTTLCLRASSVEHQTFYVLRKSLRVSHGHYTCVRTEMRLPYFARQPGLGYRSHLDRDGDGIACECA
ncbi:excalibur calcium-binding domain-containing protein [Corynebacterium variabile]|uniref:excalibur calcium-binding domain-containing protein n=1 Tax=Corynebacterium variabile TaxID=1727 RepID=UPI003FCF76B2